jgi:hypothetical protein
VINGLQVNIDDDHTNVHLVSINGSPVSHTVTDNVATLKLPIPAFISLDTVLSLSLVDRDTILEREEGTVIVESRGTVSYIVILHDGNVIPVNNVPASEVESIAAKVEHPELSSLYHQRVTNDGYNWSRQYLFNTLNTIKSLALSRDISDNNKQVISALLNLTGRQSDEDYLLNIDKSYFAGHEALLDYLSSDNGVEWVRQFIHDVTDIKDIGLTLNQTELLHILSSIVSSLISVTHSVKAVGNVRVSVPETMCSV